VRAAPEIECHTGAWNTYIGFAVLAIIVYAIGIPLVIVSVLIWGRQKQWLDAPEFILKYGALVLPYRERFYWWEVVNCLRKFILVLIIVFGAEADRRFIQIALCVLVMLILFIAQVFAAPYKFSWHNRVTSAWVCCALCVLLSAIFFISDRLSDSERIFYADMLIVIVVLSLAFTVWVLRQELQANRVREATQAKTKVDVFELTRNQRKRLVALFPDTGRQLFRHIQGMNEKKKLVLFKEITSLLQRADPEQEKHLSIQ